MSTPNLTSPKGFAIVVGVVLSLGAIGWAVSARSASARTTSTLPKELQIDALKAQTADPAKVWETAREARQREDLTEEQRRELGRNMREVVRTAMNERVDAYFNAPEDQKVALLDAQIDQFVAMRQEWEKERQNRPGANEGEPNRGPRDREGFQMPSQEERKSRSESRNPDQMARQMAYFSAMQQRAKERGIQMPGRGPGGFGPGGFGGGGPRGGGGRGGP